MSDRGGWRAQEAGEDGGGERSLRTSSSEQPGGGKRGGPFILLQKCHRVGVGGSEWSELRWARCQHLSSGRGRAG